MKSIIMTALAAAGLAAISAGAVLAHGAHRSCEEGRYGWHRHAGQYAQHRVVCERPYRQHHRQHDRCVTKCKGFGPFKSCKTVCD